MKTEGPQKQPQTVDDVVNQIIDELSFKGRKEISRLRNHDVKLLQLVFGMYTKKQIVKFNSDVNCQDINDGFAVANIIHRLRDRLCKSSST